ncbi:response regulator transcription factor [Membranihabitans maritimus]|uniref:response regulator transcription factor n=1 Tax=Membranihabitans maritimus TaxID=2904244 RepID=UPI001F3D47F9|nr:response regulator transcription factor [Membranihabitans maritimus]
MEDKIQVVLADDHILVRDGIKALLEDEKDIDVVAEASDGLEAMEVMSKISADVLIADIRMPGKTGIEVISSLKNSGAPVHTLVLSMHDSEEYVLQSIDAGADGYLLKGSSKEEFIKAIHTVHSGSKYFSGDISAILLKNYNSPPQQQEPKEEEKSLREEFGITKRENEILSHILDGKNNKEIATELKISKRTAEVHRFNLMKKLDVKNLVELTKKARELDLF